MDLLWRRSFLPLTIAVVMLACPLAVRATSVAQTFEFDESDLSIELLDGFHVVRLAGSIESFDEGMPALPVHLVTLALPPGMDVIGVDASADAIRSIEGSFLVRPAQRDVPISMPELAEWTPPDPVVYASSELYPKVLCEFMGTGNMGGQRVASIAVRPVRYAPAEGRLEFAGKVRVSLELEKATQRDRMPGPLSDRSRAARLARARAVVANPSRAALPPTAPDRIGTVDYLLITSASYVSLFQPLADWKTAKGVPAEIVTTSTIYATYPGVDNQEMIRNCIIDYYENHGTTWVLLGGDTSVIPDRIAYAKSGDSGDDLRCDLYYADLDGSWNDDGDDRWGEVFVDNIDMYADVFVGRAPVNTTTEVSRFVNRTLTYEGSPAGALLPTDYQLDMLFLAEVLWDSPWTDHAICKNMIDDDSVPPRFDPITKLYQTNGLLTKTNTLNELNAGHNIINHNGHSNWNVMSIGSSSLYRSDFDGLTNGTRYGIMYSIGCWAAAIDYDCMAEHWVNAPNGGGVAFVGNTRYGWGSPGSPGYGTSDLFDREFFNQLFYEGNDQIGVTTAAHRDAFVGTARTSEYHRFCLYELVLLGDPEMRIWTDVPDIPATVDHMQTLPLGEHPFVVTVSRDGEPIPGALALLQGENVYESGVTDEGGAVVLSPAPATEGSITLTVTGPGMSPYQIVLSAVDQPPDTEAPGAVTTLVTADPFDTGGKIELDWNGYAAPLDFAYYLIYRSGESFDDVSGLSPLSAGIIDPAATAWTDSTVADGEIFFYAVTAIDHAANEIAVVRSMGPVAATNNARIFVWDADDDDKPFDGVTDDFSTVDGTEVPWVEALDALGELYCIADTLPPDLSPFDLVIYLGGIINFGDGCFNVSMTDDDAAALTDHVDGGGSLYVEEPNFATLYCDNGSAATIELWSRFHSLHEAGLARTIGNVETLSGIGGALMSGMSLSYDYQGWPDQFVCKITPDGSSGSSLIWLDQSGDGRGSVYANQSTGARLYMVPTLLGGLSDGSYPSTRTEHVSRLLDDAGLLGTSGIDGGLPGPAHALAQNAPNPFNPETSIRFTVGSERARVSLAVYDVAGRLVATLLDGRPGAGEHVARWDGRDDAGRQVASGIYFARLSVDGWTAARKMVLLK